MRKYIFGIAFCVLCIAISTGLAQQPSEFSTRGPGGGGALFSPSFNPNSANELYLECDMSEIFHSTDYGATWSILDFRNIQSQKMASVQFSSGGVRYAIDGSNTNGTDHMQPMKSTDNGTTWQHITNDATADDAYTIFADPNNNQHLMMSDYNTLYWSSNGAASFMTVYHTTNNNAGLAIGGAYFNGNNIFIGTNEGVVTSTNNGATFDTVSLTGIPSGESIVSFCGATSGNTTRLYCITLSQVYAGVTGSDYGSYKNIYKCDWGSGKWTAIGGGLDASAEPFFVSSGASDINYVYVAGGSTGDVPAIYKSTDAGSTWSSSFQTSNNKNIQTGWSGQGGDRAWSYGEYALGFAVAPNNPNVLVMTDLGFAHISTDAGVSWHASYVPAAELNPPNVPTPTGKSYHSVGLENTSSWNLAWLDASTMVAGYSDIKAIRSSDAGTTWGFGYSGDNDNSMYDVISVGTIAYAATSTRHDMYQSTTLANNLIDGQTGRVLFSTDKGASWQVEHSFSHPVVWLATAPSDSKTIYASVVNSSTGGIYVTHNADQGTNSTWTQLTNPPRTEGHPLDIRVLKNGNLLASFSGHRTTNFTASSGVFLSTDGGSSWQDRSDNGMKYWTWDVVVDPYDATENTWYAGVFSGWGGSANGLGGLYKTTNAGVTWQMIKSLQGVTSVTFSPNNSNVIWVTTEVDGLWYCGNRNDANYSLVQVASYPFRQPERVFYNPYDTTEIWVTSFGGGLWVGKTEVSSSLAKTILISPASGASGVSISPMLTWQSVSEVISYTVQIASDSGFTNIVESAHPTQVIYSPTKLSQSSTYYWRVMAVGLDSIDAGPWSDIWNFSTSSPTLSAPIPLTPGNLSHNVDTALWFSWTPVPNATGYVLQVSLDGSFIGGLIDTTVSDTAVYMTNLYLATSYYWRVKAIGDGNASSSWYAVWNFTTTVTSDVVTLPSNGTTVKILSNPFGSSLGISISTNTLQSIQLVLYDLLGREVVRSEEKNISVEGEVHLATDDLPNGEYILEARIGQNVSRSKVIHLE